MIDAESQKNIVQAVEHHWSEEFEPAKKVICSVGDEDYKAILELLAKKRDNRHQEQIDRWTSDLELSKKSSLSSEEDFRRRIYKLIRCSEYVRDIDYSKTVKAQLEIFNEKSNGKKSLTGIPFAFFLEHFHSYFLIKDYLLKSKEPVVIVRFDAHCDAYYEKSKRIGGSNYVFYLMFDKEVSGKIKEVITVGGAFPASSLEKFERDKEREKHLNQECCSSYIINGIRHTLCCISDLPAINEPSILDIDMDGTELPIERPHMHGYFMLRKSELYATEYDNQKSILIHPKVAAGILQQKVRDPKLILTATERGFRNGYFHYRVEHDFLEQLAS